MTILWQACAEQEWCVQIPLDGKKCLSAKACIRVLEEGTAFFLEIELLGARERIPLGNSCVEARYYVFAAKACIANLDVQPRNIQFDVILQLCIDANLGPLHVSECLNIYKQHVRIAFLSGVDLEALEVSHPSRHILTQSLVRIPAFIELTLDPAQEVVLTGML
jgi:hypothetical protein